MPRFLRTAVRCAAGLLLLASGWGAPSAQPSSAAVAAEGVATPGDGSPLVLLPGLRQRIEDRLTKVRATRADAGASAPAAPASAPGPASGAAPRRPAGAAPGTRASGAPLEQPLASRPGRAYASPAPPHAPAARAAPRLPPASWAYEGEGGPEAWGRLQPGYATCATGQRQSPIDIQGGIAVELETIVFEYQPGAFRVIDTGHTVQVNVAPGNFLSVGGRRYELQQFHFHRPSEERIDGRQFAMGVHFVHRSADGRLAELAVLLDEGPAQPVVQLVWNNLPLEKHEEQAAPMPLDPGALLPADRRYATYMGSQTTPPCSEGVLWLVMKQPVTLSAEQAAIFARLYPMNARPVQLAHGRLIKESK
jgi:carbonic anhydrase